MRATPPKPSIALLARAFATCAQEAFAQKRYTASPAQPAGTAEPSAHRQVRPGSLGRVAVTGTQDIGEAPTTGPGAAANGVGNGTGDLAALPPLNAAGNGAKAATVAGKYAGIGAAGLFV